MCARECIRVYVCVCVCVCVCVRAYVRACVCLFMSKTRLEFVHDFVCLVDCYSRLCVCECLRARASVLT